MGQSISGELRVGGRMAARLTIDYPTFDKVRGLVYYGRLLEADNYLLGREGPFELRVTTERRVRRYRAAKVILRDGQRMAIEAGKEE